MDYFSSIRVIKFMLKFTSFDGAQERPASNQYKLWRIYCIQMMTIIRFIILHHVMLLMLLSLSFCFLPLTHFKQFVSVSLSLGDPAIFPHPLQSHLIKTLFTLSLKWLATINKIDCKQLRGLVWKIATLNKRKCNDY